MRTAVFSKQENGNVLVEITDGNKSATYSLRSDRDIVPSVDGTKVVIDLYENSDRLMVFLPSELDFENSFPSSPNPTNISGAIKTLSSDFFFKVAGGGQPVANSVYVLDTVITAGQEAGFQNLLLQNCISNPLVQIELDMIGTDNFTVNPLQGSIAFNPPVSVGDNVRILVILQS